MCHNLRPFVFCSDYGRTRQFRKPVRYHQCRSPNIQHIRLVVRLIVYFYGCTHPAIILEQVSLMAQMFFHL